MLHIENLQKETFRWRGNKNSSNIRRGFRPKTYGAEAFVKIARQKRNPESLRFFWKNIAEERSRNKKISFPSSTGGRRISGSAFLSRRIFGRYGSIFAAKRSSNGRLQAVVSSCSDLLTVTTV